MQDMMHCLHPSILERKRAQLQWQQQQESNNNNNNNFSIESLLSMQGDGWPSLTSSAPYPIGIRDEERGTTTTNTTPIPTPTTSNVSNSISSKKKRKADNRTPMEGGDDDGEKRMKKGDEGSEGEKKQREDENNGKKVDYIHVRARRGQATDSHSLAERVRRERISERMKYLQGLVPGCDKVTGKAGMLDEIINYVQSLQRQVEFLSMKLATVNPRPDLNIETLIRKEMMNNVLACNSHSIHNNNNSNNNSSSSMGIMQEMMLDPSLLLHLSSMQQSMAINPVDLIALQRSTISMPEPFILDSCFNAMQRTSSGWDSEVHSLSGVEFHQERSSPFLFQSLQGNVLPNNPKMEM